jgi:putative endonuclease
MSKTFWVYIITNHTNTVLYTGVTNDLARRVFEHKTGLIRGSFSKKYRLYKLIWSQEFHTPLEAIAAEKKIKGWTRSKKLVLVQSINPKLENLSLR